MSILKNKESPIYIVLGGMLALAIVMGIGRFAYTPILPLMQVTLNLSDSFVGYLASSNYLGYLVGALLAGILRWRKGKTYHLRIFLITNILTTLAMGVSENYYLWHLLRFLSGLTSGIVFVLASSIVLDCLARNKRLSWSGIFYSGVGLGILLTGILVPNFNQYYGWEGSWIGLGVFSILLFGFVLFLVKEKQTTTIIPRVSINTKQPSYLNWLIASYGCEGIGYIVSGTFIVAIVQQIPTMSHAPTISWIIVGAAAIPSCIIWAYVAKQWGNVITLQVLFTIQIIGVILPVLFVNAYGALVASFLFGATFMGITTLFVMEARQIVPNHSNQVIGYLTFVYGAGQMIGPAVSGHLIERSGNYNSALLFSAIVLVIGMIFLVIYKEKLNQIKKLEDDRYAIR